MTLKSWLGEDKLLSELRPVRDDKARRNPFAIKKEREKGEFSKVPATAKSKEHVNAEAR
jgi:hypothetical protein